MVFGGFGGIKAMCTNVSAFLLKNNSYYDSMSVTSPLAVQNAQSSQGRSICVVLIDFGY